MNTRCQKIALVSQLTQKELDKLLKQLGLLERAILQKQQQISTLEKYQKEYGKKTNANQNQSLFLIKNLFQFNEMLQKTIDKIYLEIDELNVSKENFSKNIQKLHIKKESIENYLTKIREQEKLQQKKIEQKILDEFSVLNNFSS